MFDFDTATLLEVVIGLAFVYLVLSLICSAIIELLVKFMRLRARELQYGIARMLLNEDLTKSVLNQPLIKSLGSTQADASFSWDLVWNVTKDDARFKWRYVRWVKTGLRSFGQRREFDGWPSYIPAQTFSQALLDRVAGESGAVSVETIRRTATEWLSDVDETKRQLGEILLDLIEASQDGRRLMLTVEDINAFLDQLADSKARDEIREKLAGLPTLDEVREALDELPDSRPKRTLINALEEGRADLNRLRSSIEGWYDAAMDRVSGIYKRQTQRWLLLVALAVTLILGADTIQIYDSLSTNPTLRAAIVARAQEAVANQDNETPTRTPEEIQEDVDALEPTFGWYDIPSPTDWKWYFLKITGILATTLLVSLGAPFWFDLLTKVSNLRGAGKVPEKADSNSGSES